MGDSPYPRIRIFSGFFGYWFQIRQRQPDPGVVFRLIEDRSVAAACLSVNYQVDESGWKSVSHWWCDCMTKDNCQASDKQGPLLWLLLLLLWGWFSHIVVLIVQICCFNLRKVRLETVFHSVFAYMCTFRCAHISIKLLFSVMYVYRSCRFMTQPQIVSTYSQLCLYLDCDKELIWN